MIPQPANNTFETIQPNSLAGEQIIPPSFIDNTKLQPTIDNHTSPKFGASQAHSQPNEGITLEDDNSNSSFNQEEILALKKIKPSEALLRMQKLRESSITVMTPDYANIPEPNIEAPILALIFQIKEHIF